MGKIHVLDISVANLIAAGEVVERPCNAAKELVENAIDAGARRITVEIRRGGIGFLRVTDDGSGMSAEDAVTATLRHATSKIKTASDLTAIGTLGFRGEALAAITSVSAFRILTKRREDAEGTLVAGAYGKTEEISAAGCPDGTTIICERLFATTPARLKFLKSDASEGSAVMGMLEKLALSHPEIAFQYLADGVLKFSTSGDGVLKNAVYSVHGSEFASKMIAVHGGARGISVEGYISTPDYVRGNRAMQQFFINDRSVRSKSLTAALEAAFASYLAPQKYPSCVLNIQISPTLVDVNIHPAKLEVKFSDEKAVFDAMYSAVRGTLVSAVSRPVLAFTETKLREEGNLEMMGKGVQTTLDLKFSAAAEKGKESEKAPEKQETIEHLPVAEPQKEEKIIEKPAFLGTKPEKIGTNSDFSSMKSTEISSRLYGAADSMKPKRFEPISDDDITVDVPRMRERPENPMARFSLASRLSFADAPPAAPPRPAKSEEEKRPHLGSTDAKIPEKEAKTLPPYRIVGEVFASYVIVETEGKMLLIDKHAAHERINFERLRASMNADRPASQLLLMTDTVEMTEEELTTAEDCRADLEKVGFLFEIGKKEVRLSGIPADMARAEAITLFRTLVTEMAETGRSVADTHRELFEKALYQSACKASVKAGRVYDEAHIRWIVENLLRYDCIKFCPHGRPVAFELSKKELDTRFGRT